MDEPVAKNQKWILRQAIPTDLDEIVQFHSAGTFKSLDYMPVSYQKMLQDKNANTFVTTTHEGIVIGFANYYLLDEERVCRVAIRVHEKHQGQGVMHWMLEHALRSVVGKHPRVHREAWCSRYQPYLDKELKVPGATLDREVIRLIYRLTRAELEQITKDVKNSMSDQANQQIHKQLSLDETKRCLADPTTVKELFTDKVFFAGIEWLPFNTTLKHLMHAAAISHTYGSFEADSGRCVGLSFCGGLKTPGGSTHDLLFYGQDQNVVRNHLNLYICHLSEVTDPDQSALSVSVQIPASSFDQDKQMEDYMSPYNDTQNQSDLVIKQRLLAVSKPIKLLTNGVA